ncbi:MAG: TIM barrel protein [Solirubrobacterales bacterium]|nr:TIM barrel protein [Solirubrobacterales bacterium]
MPSRAGADGAVHQLRARGYDACEIDFGKGFWMSWRFAERLGVLAREERLALSIHAPMAAFLGHPEVDGPKHHRAIGMLDHAAGIAAACGAAPVVLHPGFLLGRSRAEALDAVIEQLAALRARLERSGRAVPFGVEVMGRARDLGTLDDVLAICRALPWVRPVLDFAHLHAVTGGGFVTVDAFAEVLAAADDAMGTRAPFHIHFYDVVHTGGNERAHVPYGEGTLRAEPWPRRWRGSSGRPRWSSSRPTRRPTRRSAACSPARSPRRPRRRRPAPRARARAGAPAARASRTGARPRR